MCCELKLWRFIFFASSTDFPVEISSCLWLACLKQRGPRDCQRNLQRMCDSIVSSHFQVALEDNNVGRFAVCAESHLTCACTSVLIRITSTHSKHTIIFLAGTRKHNYAIPFKKCAHTCLDYSSRDFQEKIEFAFLFFNESCCVDTRAW